MAASIDRLESELLSLSSSDRARLAESLIASLDEPSELDPAAVEQAWIEEAERRYQRYKAGEEPAHPADEVLARVRTILEKH